VSPLEKAQLYLQLAAWERQRGDGRRGAEWQINIAIWGNLSLSINTRLAAILGNTQAPSLFCPAAVLVIHVVVLFTYLFWSAWLHDANWRDRQHADRYRNEVDAWVQGQKLDFGCVVKPPDRCFFQKLRRIISDGKHPNVSGITQCMVTLLLTILSLLLWLRV